MEERWSGKRWIDGKKIYQKTMSGPSLSVAGLQAQAHNILNISQVILTSVTIKHNTNNQTLNLPAYQSATVYAFFECDLANTVIRQGTAPLGNFATTFIVNYTCTDR